MLKTDKTIILNDHFTKDRLGTNTEKTQKEMRFLNGGISREYLTTRWGASDMSASHFDAGSKQSVVCGAVALKR